MSWKDALPSKIVRSDELATGSSEAAISVTRHWLEDGNSVVSKIAAAATDELAIEARMLRYLGEKTGLRVPHVLFEDDRVVVMEWLEAGGEFSGRAEEQAADAIATLHGIGAERYGFDWDTVIAGLPQDNSWQDDWYTFYAEQRLIPMARACVERGRSEGSLIALTEGLSAKLPRLLDPPRAPGLVHGDLWGGNILAGRDGLSGFIDPAIYYADPEMDLAYGTLFGSLGPGFFERYREHRPLSDDFGEARREIYNLWPLLVHLRLFGGHYEAQVRRTLERYAG